MPTYISPTGSIVKPSKRTGAPRKGSRDLAAIIAKPGALRSEIYLERRAAEEQATMSERALSRASNIADALEASGIDRALAEDAALSRPRVRLEVGKGDRALSVSPSSTLGRALLAISGRIR